MSLEWMNDAACVGTDPESFFSDHPDDVAAARAVCGGCPARNACLQYAVDNRFEGLWAGTTDRQRTEIRSGARELVECDECGNRFPSNKSLAAHKSHHHSERRNINKQAAECPECGLTFKSKQGVANHVTYKHKEFAA